MKKKLFAAIAISALLFAYTQPKAETFIRNRAVQLLSDTGACSGEQVQAPSGKTYILTAAHCGILARVGYITAVDEAGSKFNQKIIAEDSTSDLLLLEGLPELPGLRIAAKDYRAEHVRAFTHGHAAPLYKTEGELLGDKHLIVPIKEIKNEDDLKACLSMPKYVVVPGDDIFMETLCSLSTDGTVTTASVIPGSSGGMVVNDDGELVGVVSATDGYFGYLVRLQDIQKFLLNR